MRRVRSWALSALAAIVVLCGANTALALDIELEAGDAPGNGSTAGAINNAFNGKYYMSGGKIYQVNYVYDNLALNYDIVHTEVTTPQSVINLITNRTDNTYEGSSTGGGTTAMSNAGSNSVSMSDAQSNISSSIDMTPNIGGGNSLEITAGNQSAGTISVGQGNITINNSAGNTTIGGTITTSQGSSNWTVGGGTVSGSLVAGTTGTGDTMTVTNTEFTATGEIRAESNNNSITVGNGSSFLNGSEILSTGTENRVRIEGNANTETGSLITMTGGRSYLDLYLGSGTANEAKTLVNSTITLNGGYNTLSVGNNSEISNATTISITGANNTFNFHDWSRFDADWNLADNYHTLNLTEAADFDGTMNFTGSGIIANINLTYDNTDLFPAPNMTGQIVFETAAGAPDVANTVNISSGTLTNLNGSVIASNTVDTAFNVSGGLSTLLVSGEGAKSTYTITGGNVHNIRQRDGDPLNFNSGTWETDYLAKTDLTGVTHSVTYGGGAQDRFQSYSILNADTVTTTATSGNTRTITSIGEFVDDDGDSDGKRDTGGRGIASTIANQAAPNYTQPSHTMGTDDYGNQLTTKNLTVEDNSKLIIHADETHLGKDEADIATNDEKSIADNTVVRGELTLDRSSLHGEGFDGSAEILVETDGILYGFGEDVDAPAGAEHWDQYEQKRANLYGDLTLKTGATLQPYDLGLSSSYYKGGLKFSDDGLFDNWDYNEEGDEHRGAVFRVSNGDGAGGITTFMNGSIMRSRLFHDVDGRDVSLLGERDNSLPNPEILDTQYSDSLLSWDVDFSDVLREVNNNTGWDAQDKKVRYDPVFGFQYDVKSKQEFNLYLDNDLARLNQDKTYYFAVVNSENEIAELGGYNDANHLFNKLILKSDMLGKYDFLKSEDNQSIYLRYRQLAYHPTEGGIKRTMTEGLNRNEIVPGQYLDEIRYPFRGQPGSDLNGVLSIDPSEDVNDMVNGGYNEAGYNGDMRDFYYYATRAPGDPDHDPALYNPVFDNYRPEWIDDWANLFQGMQLDVADNADMHRAVQMLHAETYANISQTAFDVLNQFTRNRERNAVSALFQVEKEFREEAMAKIDGGDEAYASLAEFDPADFYVKNPIRFWASAFGAHGDQSNNSGGHNEMAYDATVWGGSVGAVKELGDYYVGATLGYADATAQYHSAEAKSKSYIAEGLVGARIFCLGFAEAYASYSYNDHKNVRVVDLASNQLGGYYGVATGDFASHVFSGGVRLGYQKTIGEDWLLIPTLGVNVMHHRGTNFTESGRWTMANRMVFDKDSMNRTTVRIPVEVRLNRAIALGDFMLMPEVRAGITPLLGDKNGEATAKWVGNPIDNRYFTSYGADRGSFEGWVGTTIELSKRGRFYAAANYDYVYGSKYGAHNYSVQAGINF